MTTQEIVKRLRIGAALLIGFAAGKGLAAAMGHHPSEFFIGGFGAGFLLTHGAYWLFDGRRTEPPP